MEKFPDRVPVVVESQHLEKPIRYLMPKVLKVCDVIGILRQKKLIKQHEAIFLFIKKNGTLPPMSYYIGDIYYEHRSSDDILYLKFTIENTFG